eukprot:1174390-Prorocentrum_minimum.AAC.6
MIVADDSWGEGLQERWESISGLVDTSVPVWSAWTEVMKLTHMPGSKLDDKGSSKSLPSATRSEFPKTTLVEASAAEAAAAAALVRHNKHTHNADNMSRRAEAEAEAHTPLPRPGTRSGYGKLGMDRLGVSTPPTPDVRLHNRVVVVAAGSQRTPVNQSGGLQVAALVRQLSLDQFENEGRRVRDYTLDGDSPTPSSDATYLPLVSISPVATASPSLPFPPLSSRHAIGALRLTTPTPLCLRTPHLFPCRTNRRDLRGVCTSG